MNKQAFLIKLIWNKAGLSVLAAVFVLVFTASAAAVTAATAPLQAASAPDQSAGTNRRILSNDPEITAETVLNETVTLADKGEYTFDIESEGVCTLRISINSASQKTYFYLYTPTNKVATIVDKADATSGTWNVNQWGTVTLTRAGESAQTTLEYQIYKGTYTLKVTGSGNARCIITAELLHEEPEEWTEQAYIKNNGPPYTPFYFRHDHRGHFTIR